MPFTNEGHFCLPLLLNNTAFYTAELILRT